MRHNSVGMTFLVGTHHSPFGNKDLDFPESASATSSRELASLLPGLVRLRRPAGLIACGDGAAYPAVLLEIALVVLLGPVER
jgi:hypothetical protein